MAGKSRVRPERPDHQVARAPPRQNPRFITDRQGFLALTKVPGSECSADHLQKLALPVRRPRLFHLPSPFTLKLFARRVTFLSRQPASASLILVHLYQPFSRHFYLIAYLHPQPTAFLPPFTFDYRVRTRFTWPGFSASRPLARDPSEQLTTVMGLNYYASSPTVVLPPQQPPTYPIEQRFNAQHYSALPTPGSSSKPRRTPKYPTPPSLNYQAAPSHAIAGRKRSLDDVDSLADEASADGSRVITKPKPEPIMGPGMTLIYPGEPGFSLAAESQTGTWAEAKNEVQEANKPAERPIAASRKSQRTDSIINAASVSPAVKPVSTLQSAPGGIDQSSLAYKATTMRIDDAGHTIHDLTMALGIGWKEIVFNPAKQEGARGWARFISRHYPLSRPQLLHESEAHDAFLVFACDDADELEKFFLFSQDLRSCRLISTSLEGVVRNLTQHPIVFESDVVNARDLSASPVSSPASSAPINAEMSIDAPAVQRQTQMVDTAMEM
ncbi:uncharacterized protein J3D65DRAFT_604500 [Phyllosticta citribraziliensis]|uniref:Uncharacterized protein n=1 Tax=Phyllosticta citribraziliensis TaxID=989973 RepID=A0ABR1LMX1_9PEZI